MIFFVFAKLTTSFGEPFARAKYQHYIDRREHAKLLGHSQTAESARWLDSFLEPYPELHWIERLRVGGGIALAFFSFYSHRICLFTRIETVCLFALKLFVSSHRICQFTRIESVSFYSDVLYVC